MRAGVIYSMVWVLLAIAACSTSDDSDPALEARIKRVVNGLHVRQSVQSVPAEKWTIEERMERSTFQQPLPATFEVHAAVGHHEDGEPLPGRWRIQPELAATGLWTTASDLARFLLGVRAAANQSPEALLSAQHAAALTTQRFINFSLGSSFTATASTSGLRITAVMRATAPLCMPT
jgi:hypothetical protein